jgi:hypothetical protein
VYWLKLREKEYQEHGKTKKRDGIRKGLLNQTKQNETKKKKEEESSKENSRIRNPALAQNLP